MTADAVEYRPNGLVGTWKLVDALSRTPTGEKAGAPFGVSPVGCLIYTSDGRISALISYGDRKPLSTGGGRMEEQAEAFKTFLAYAGRYSVNGDKVIHHVEVCSIQNYVNQDLSRTIKFDGDRITLITPPTRVNGKIQIVELIWQRHESI